MILPEQTALCLTKYDDSKVSIDRASPQYVVNLSISARNEIMFPARLSNPVALGQPMSQMGHFDRVLRTRHDTDCTGCGGKRSPETKPKIVVPGNGGAPEAVRRAEGPGSEDPGTAAKDTGCASTISSCRAVDWRAVVILV